MDICFHKHSDICPRKCLAAFTLPQEPRARTGPATISSILCIVYLPRWKGAAAKCSFRCRAFRRWGLRWPCCASSRTVLNSLSVRVQVMTLVGSWAGVGETDSVVRQGASGATSKWRDVLRGGASNAHAPPPVAVLPGPCPPQEPQRQLGAQRSGATASPEGLGEPRARTGPRKEGTHCLSRVLVPWPRDYCNGCTVQSHRDLLSEVFSARAFAWRLRLRVSR